MERKQAESRERQIGEPAPDERISQRLGCVSSVHTMISSFQTAALAAISLSLTGIVGAPPDVFTVRDFGGKGDGKTDEPAAFQKALDAAAQAGGGTVQAGRGNFYFAR